MKLNKRLKIILSSITLFFSCAEDVEDVVGILTSEDLLIGVITSNSSNATFDQMPIGIIVTFGKKCGVNPSDSTIFFDQSDVIVSNADISNFVNLDNESMIYTFTLQPHSNQEGGDYDKITVDIPEGVCANSSTLSNSASQQFSIERVENTEVPEVSAIKENISIHGIITDFTSNERISDVTVYWVDNEDVLWIKSDNLGYYIIDSLLAGSKYELTYQKIGFATMNSLITLDSVVNQEINLTKNISIYPLTSSIHGTIYKKIDTAHIDFAEYVTVIAEFSDPSSTSSFSPNQYTTTTNSTGQYSFYNLPSTENLNLKTLPYYSNEYNFSVQSQYVSLSPDMTVEVDNIILQLDSFQPFVVHNTLEHENLINIDNNLVLTFSTAMDDESFSIELKNSATNDIVPLSSNWDNAKITLTIDPLVKLKKGEAYSLSISGLSQNNGNFSEIYTFNTENGIEYVSTNINNFEGNFDNFNIFSDILIHFSIQPDLSNINNSIVLIDASGNEISIDYSSSGNTLTIIPSADLEYGETYNLGYIIYSELSNDFVSGVFTFQTLENVVSLPSRISDFYHLDWGWNFNSTQFTFKWTSVENIIGYKIYAYDNNLNTDNIKVGTYPANDHLLYQEASVDLSLFPQFDYYVDDGIQTPLAGDVRVYFYVVAYNELGESEPSTHHYVYDTIAPAISVEYDSTNNYGPNNSLYSSRSFNLILSANEYMDLNFSYYFGESGGDPYLLDTNDVSFKWDADRSGGKMTISVDGYQNGAGGDTLIITDLKDNSLNKMWKYFPGAYSDDYYFILGGYKFFNFNDNEIPNEFSQGNANNLWLLTNSSYDTYEGGYSLISNSDTSFTADSIQFSINIPKSTNTTIKFVSKGVTFGEGEFFVNGESISTLTNASFIQTEYSFITPSSSESNTFKWVYNSGNSEGYFVIDMIELIW